MGVRTFFLPRDVGGIANALLPVLTNLVKVARMLKAIFYKVKVKPALKPVLSFNINVENRTKPPVNLALLDFSGEILLEGKAIGESQCHTLPQFLAPNSAVSLPLVMDIDYHMLERVEALRKGGDFAFSIDYGASVGLDASSAGTAYGTAIGYSKIISHSGSVTDFTGSSGLTVAKSEWVEKILPALGVKRVVLYELPVIEPLAEFKEAIHHYEDAHKHYYFGSFAEALTSCRKSFESIKGAIKKYGYVKEGEIDFVKLYGSEITGEGVNKLFKGAWSFFDPSAHTGRVMNREDVELALSVAHGVLRGITEILRRRVSPR